MAVQITIDVRQVQSAFARAPGNAKKAMLEAVVIAMMDAQTLLIRGTPVSCGYDVKWNGGSNYSVRKARGGSLRQSLMKGANYNLWEVRPEKLEGEIGTKLKTKTGFPYPVSIIGDTKPYVIKPKKKRLMFAVGPRPAPYPRGDIIFAKQVTHPGGIKLTGGGTGKGLLSRTADVIEEKGPTIVTNVFNRRGLF